jgi:hypothetical protein
MPNYKITYTDGTTHTITTGGDPRPQGEWLVFLDGTGELLRVRAEEVKSVARDGVPERQKSEVSDAQQRTGKVHGFN